MDWKFNIVQQLKSQNIQTNIYHEIIIHYNRLLENNTKLKIQCADFEKDINFLRLAKAGLEKASEASQEVANINNKLTVANEEVIMHLREKGELAQEVVRLNRTLTDLNDKLIKGGIINEQYKTQNEQLVRKIEKAESEISQLIQSNQLLQEELSAVQDRYHQLQSDYNEIKPACLELEQKLESERRLNKQREDELMSCKQTQLEMLNAEVERYNKRVQEKSSDEMRRNSGVTSDKNVTNPNPIYSNDKDMIENSANASVNRDRGNTVLGINVFSSFKKMFAPGTISTTTDKLSRTSTCCVSATVPTHDVNHWDCTELEVYTILFQPSGSLLATGCSDKMIHLWEISSTGQAHKYGSLQGSHGAINAIDFDNEGARLIAGCSNEKAYIWSYGDTRMLKDTLTGHDKSIYACKFISGIKLATGSGDRLIKVWDLHSQQCTRTLFAGSKCHDLVVKDASGTIISGHFDKKIRIWDTFTDKCRIELSYNASVTSLSYNIEKQQLLACLKDDTLKLIDLRQNNTVYTFTHDNFHVSMDTNKCILSPDGCYACVGSQNGSLFIWNTSTGVLEQILNKRHTTMVTSMAWHPAGRFLASSEKHRQVVLWTD